VDVIDRSFLPGSDDHLEASEEKSGAIMPTPFDLVFFFHRSPTCGEREAEVSTFYSNQFVHSVEGERTGDSCVKMSSISCVAGDVYLTALKKADPTRIPTENQFFPTSYRKM
jgi:hypothetical protein